MRRRNIDDLFESSPPSPPRPASKSKLATLADQLGYKSGPTRNLKLAFYPASTKSATAENNERLEFLGDSVLRFVVADHLYRANPDATEGWLSGERTNIENARSQELFARTLHIDEIFVELNGGMPAGEPIDLIASAFEAVIGAVHLDLGLVGSTRLCLSHIKYVSTSPEARQMIESSNPVGKLQEFLHWWCGANLHFSKPTQVAGGFEVEATFALPQKPDFLVPTTRGVAQNGKWAKADAAAKLLEYLKTTSDLAPTADGRQITWAIAYAKWQSLKSSGSRAPK